MQFGISLFENEYGSKKNFLRIFSLLEVKEQFCVERLELVENITIGYHHWS